MQVSSLGSKSIIGSKSIDSFLNRSSLGFVAACINPDQFGLEEDFLKNHDVCHKRSKFISGVGTFGEESSLIALSLNLDNPTTLLPRYVMIGTLDSVNPLNSLYFNLLITLLDLVGFKEADIIPMP